MPTKSLSPGQLNGHFRDQKHARYRLVSAVNSIFENFIGQGTGEKEEGDGEEEKKIGANAYIERIFNNYSTSVTLIVEKYRYTVLVL